MESYLLVNGKLIHNIFNINLTNFGQLDVKGDNFFSLQVLGEVLFCQISKEAGVTTLRYFYNFVFFIYVNTNSVKITNSS